MKTTLSAAIVRDAVRTNGLYETPDGRRFGGAPVSEVPRALRECGWRNTSHLDEHDLSKLGLEIVDARYIGGARPKRFCRVVVGRDADDARNPHIGWPFGKCRKISSDISEHMEIIAAEFAA